MSHLRFRANDEEFELTSTDEEYDQNEKRLLNKFRNKKPEESESETEVFGVGSENNSDDESDDDGQSDIALSDVEGQELDDNLPDARAWGKEKRKYYGTDYVDPDYGGFQEKDARAAEIEEEEARNLQRQLVQQLDDNDFSLDIIFRKIENEKVKDQNEELIKTDLSKLTNKQKLQILQKESPEFFALVEDFKVKMTIARDFLHPVMQKYRSGDIKECKAVQFVQTHYHLILNYATNIYMYLLLKANKELKNHPVIQRLYQYRQLLSQMEPVFEDVIKPQIEILLSENVEKTNVDKQGSSSKPKKKILKLLARQQTEVQTKKKTIVSDSTQPSKKIKLDENVKKTKQVTFDSEDSDEITEGSDKAVNMDDQNFNRSDQKIEESTEEAGVGNSLLQAIGQRKSLKRALQARLQNKDSHSGRIGKRGITYQIAKNKGLTPHRKKEHRNPRVKHKLKFRKALIRRKGAVREPRTELKRYSGEISGIKTSVSKSIKIKS